MLKKSTILILALFLSITIFSQDNNNKFGIGVSGGWGAPYGFGLQLNYSVVNRLDLNVGGGFSFSGFRGGFGARYLIKPEGSSPFVGVNYIRTTGLSNLMVSFNEDEGEYTIPSNTAIFLRGGYIFKISKIAFLLNAGYGIALEDKTARHQNGDRTDRLQKSADLMRLGGVEFSLTVLFLL